jgi:hypothetical protein
MAATATAASKPITTQTDRANAGRDMTHSLFRNETGAKRDRSGLDGREAVLEYGAIVDLGFFDVTRIRRRPPSGRSQGQDPDYHHARQRLADDVPGEGRI